MLDTSFIKNVHGSDVVGPNPTDRGRMASKISLLTDSRGTPLCAVFHKANKHDGSTLKHTLETFQRKVAGHGNFPPFLLTRDTTLLTVETSANAIIWTHSFLEDALQIHTGGGTSWSKLSGC